MSSKSGLPLQDSEDLRGMRQRQLERISARYDRCLTFIVPPAPKAVPKLPEHLQFSRALYLPEKGELQRVVLVEGGDNEEISRALDQHQSTRVVIIAGHQKDLSLRLKGWDALRLSLCNRNWRPVSQDDLKQLGVVFDQVAEPQPAEPVPVVESDVGPDELLADVEL